MATGRPRLVGFKYYEYEINIMPSPKGPAHHRYNPRRHTSAPLIKCACGQCDRMIPSWDKGGRPRRFAYHHTNRLRMEKHIGWRGGRHQYHGYIYIYCPEHPHATMAGYMLEHRLVMEKELGRFLEKGEVVHHKNHIKTDNRIENLELISTLSQHQTMHMKMYWKRKHGI